VRRSDECLSEEALWWSPIFITWWAFSIKYFVPFAVWFLMMWNFAQDISPNADGNFYGGYHIFWQCMGFVYPLIGLCCFFIPMCCPPENLKIRTLADFANESDAEY